MHIRCRHPERKASLAVDPVDNDPSILPLDRTSHRRQLIFRTVAGFGHLLHRFEKVAAGRYSGLFPGGEAGRHGRRGPI